LQGQEEYLRAIAQREGVDERVLRQFLKRSEDEADQIIQESEQSGEGKSGRSLAAEGFADGLAVLEDATRSPLGVKKEFFEASLVDAMGSSSPGGRHADGIWGKHSRAFRVSSVPTSVRSKPGRRNSRCGVACGKSAFGWCRKTSS